MNQLAIVADKDLPAVYREAKSALATCEKVDECKDWTDKARAMEAYGRMANDDALTKMATRIRAQASRRAGELFNQIEAGKGGRGKTNAHDGNSLSRAEAAADAGISEKQRHQMQRVANVPQDQFDELVDGENPPSVSKLAEMGTEKRETPPEYLGGRTPKEFNNAMHFTGTFESVLRDMVKWDHQSIIPILTNREKERIIMATSQIRDFLRTIEKELK